jgi:hypothetical protein
VRQCNGFAGTRLKLFASLFDFLCTHSLSFFFQVLEKRRFMSGRVKNDLTEWWLNLIKDSTTSFLSSEGYDFDAVPFNYIEHAPRYAIFLLVPELKWKTWVLLFS